MSLNAFHLVCQPGNCPTEAAIMREVNWIPAKGLLQIIDPLKRQYLALLGMALIVGCHPCH